MEPQNLVNDVLEAASVFEQDWQAHCDEKSSTTANMLSFHKTGEKDSQEDFFGDFEQKCSDSCYKRSGNSHLVLLPASKT